MDTGDHLEIGHPFSSWTWSNSIFCTNFWPEVVHGPILRWTLAIFVFWLSRQALAIFDHVLEVLSHVKTIKYWALDEDFLACYPLFRSQWRSLLLIWCRSLARFRWASQGRSNMTNNEDCRPLKTLFSSAIYGDKRVWTTPTSECVVAIEGQWNALEPWRLSWCFSIQIYLWIDLWKSVFCRLIYCKPFLYALWFRL